MGFDTGPTGFEKTILSDLQGAWQCLRREVADNPGFDGWDRTLFHIDEAMSWESVRNLKLMKSTFILVQNIALQSEAPEEVMEWVDDVRESLDAAFEAIAEGEAK